MQIGPLRHFLVRHRCISTQGSGYTSRRSLTAFHRQVIRLQIMVLIIVPWFQLFHQPRYFYLGDPPQAAA